LFLSGDPALLAVDGDPERTKKAQLDAGHGATLAGPSRLATCASLFGETDVAVLTPSTPVRPSF
jgi:hypothetical protein